jgi:hypothetical protein
LAHFNKQMLIHELIRGSLNIKLHQGDVAVSVAVVEMKQIEANAGRDIA